MGMILILLSIIGVWYYKSKATASRAEKIQKLQKEALANLRRAERERERAISYYIRASENYTKILNLDPHNLQGLRGKFECILKLASHAANVLHDYKFAETMYDIAAQMGVDTQRVYAAKKSLKKRESEEEEKVREIMEMIFQYLE